MSLESIPADVRDALQTNVSMPVQLTVTYPSFQTPDYSTDTDSVVGRIWAFDTVSNLVVLETGNSSALPAAMRRAAASAVYEAGSTRGPSSGVVTGFKIVCASSIKQLKVLNEAQYERLMPHGPSKLTHVSAVPVAAMEMREAAAAKKCQERSLQLAPSEASDIGQIVFDAVNKTLPCRWHESHIIVLDEVVISGPSYNVSATYVPSLSRNQLERLLNDDDVDAARIASHVERAKDKARTWLRVTKVLDGIQTKLASVEQPSSV